MDVFNFFGETLTKQRVQRKTKLLVSKEPSKDDRKSCLSNDQWFFVVPYAFRDALDIKYQERVKTVKSKDLDSKTQEHRYRYSVWTQGRLISFKEGDLLTSKDNEYFVQVNHANPMGWDPSANKMYFGSVNYSLYLKAAGIKLVCSEGVNQLEFLNLLINGVDEVKGEVLLQGS